MRGWGRFIWGGERVYSGEVEWKLFGSVKGAFERVNGEALVVFI